MDEVIEKNAANFARAGFIVVFFGMLTQVDSSVAFPTYNIPLGFWAVYSSFSRNGRATFGFITFCVMSIIVDIIFCSINDGDSSAFKFSLAMLIITLLSKIYALYASTHFFASIGGATSLEESQLNGSHYEALAGSIDGAVGGGYYPPIPSSSSNINKIQPPSSASIINTSAGPMGRKPSSLPPSSGGSGTNYTGMADSGAF